MGGGEAGMNKNPARYFWSIMFIIWWLATCLK